METLTTTEMKESSEQTTRIHKEIDLIRPTSLGLVSDPSLEGDTDNHVEGLLGLPRHTEWMLGVLQNRILETHEEGFTVRRLIVKGAALGYTIYELTDKLYSENQIDYDHKNGRIFVHMVFNAAVMAIEMYEDLKN